MRVILIAAALLLAGCAQMYGVGQTKTQQSSFDQSTEVVMQAAHLKSPDSIWDGFSMALYWTSRQPEIVVLDLKVARLTEYKRISSVTLNMDGLIKQLQPLDVVTGYDYEQLTKASCNAFGCTSGTSVKQSSRRFIINRADIHMFASSRNAKVRVGHEKNYIVGDYHAGSAGQGWLHESLPEFLQAVSDANK